jgi:hypothetical protein
MRKTDQEITYEEDTLTSSSGTRSVTRKQLPASLIAKWCSDLDVVGGTADRKLTNPLPVYIIQSGA